MVMAPVTEASQAWDESHQSTCSDLIKEFKKKKRADDSFLLKKLRIVSKYIQLEDKTQDWYN